MTENEIAWLAGLLEGEGSFNLNKKHSIAVKLEMTDEDVVRKAQSTTGVGRVVARPSRKKGHKPTWSWVITGNNANSVLVQILPFMGARRTEAIQNLLSARVSYQTVVDIRNEKTVQVHDLRSQGLSYREIGRRLGLDHETVRRKSNLPLGMDTSRAF